MDPVQQPIVPPTVLVSPKLQITSREFFLWAGIILSLYASVSALLIIVFTTLNKALPDGLDGASFFFQGSGIGVLSTPLSIVIILFPVFTLLTFFANRIFRKSPERSALGFRKFVIWLTLFLSAAMIATDLIVLVHYFLSGEITTRFLLKILVILITGGLVGGYYIFDLKRDVKVKTFTNTIFAIIAWVLVIVSFVFAINTFGGPQNQRSLTFDLMRIQTLQQVEQGVVSYWRDHGSMPKTLGDIRSYATFADPEASSGKVIEYNYTHDTSYEICATFSTNSPKDETTTPYGYYGNDMFLPQGSTGDAWQHTSGHACFARTIDVQQFPSNTKPIPPVMTPPVQ